MNFENLKNPELQEKLKSAATLEELKEIARTEGLLLSDEQLEVSGGKLSSTCEDDLYCEQDHYCRDLAVK